GSRVVRGGVEFQSLKSVGRVVAARCIAKKRSHSGGSVVTGGDVVLHCLHPGSGIFGTCGVGIEGLWPRRCIEGCGVVQERVPAIGGVETAGAVAVEGLSPGSCIKRAVGAVLKRAGTDASVVIPYAIVSQSSPSDSRIFESC